MVQRAAARLDSPENACRASADVRHHRRPRLLPRVAAPTLRVHSRNDAVVPFEEGRLLAPRSRAPASCRSRAPTTSSSRASPPGAVSSPSAGVPGRLGAPVTWWCGRAALTRQGPSPRAPPCLARPGVTRARATCPPRAGPRGARARCPAASASRAPATPAADRTAPAPRPTPAPTLRQKPGRRSGPGGAAALFQTASPPTRRSPSSGARDTVTAATSRVGCHVNRHRSHRTSLFLGGHAVPVTARPGACAGGVGVAVVRAVGFPAALAPCGRWSVELSAGATAAELACGGVAAADLFVG